MLLFPWIIRFLLWIFLVFQNTLRMLQKYFNGGAETETENNIFLWV